MLRLILLAVTALALTTPAAAQFGGLKKKLQSKGQESATQAAPKETSGAAAGGTVALTPEVVDHLLTGLKAGQAARDAGPRENTPYGRYEKSKAEYAAAKSKCDAAQQSFGQRAARDEKMINRYSGYTEKMAAAQGKGDTQLMQIYQDSMLAMIDQSCLVKQPTQPDDYYKMQQDAEAQAEQEEVKASGMSQSELAMAKERATAILQGSTGDASSSEISAVSAKSSELKPLLGLAEPASARAMKPDPAPAAAPEPAPVPSSPQVSVETQAMGDCMTKNTLDHQAEIEALGRRAQAAQASGDNAGLMAIADTLRQIQMAGCQGQ